MKFDEIIDELEKSNPYPSDVFTEPSDKDWKRAWKLLEKNGIIPDTIAAKWGRMTWQNCINKMKELEMETTEQKAKEFPDDQKIKAEIHKSYRAFSETQREEFAQLWKECIEWLKAKNLPDDTDIIPFGMWLTGHDRETVEQMYRDWH